MISELREHQNPHLKIDSRRLSHPTSVLSTSPTSPCGGSMSPSVPSMLKPWETIRLSCLADPLMNRWGLTSLHIAYPCFIRVSSVALSVLIFWRSHLIYDPLPVHGRGFGLRGFGRSLSPELNGEPGARGSLASVKPLSQIRLHGQNPPPSKRPWHLFVPFDPVVGTWPSRSASRSCPSLSPPRGMDEQRLG